MKTTLVVPLIFFLPFIFITTKSSLGSAVPEPVLDINDKPVLYGVNYFVISAIRGAGGGGVSVAGPPGNLKGCPRSVIQEQWDLNKGLPVKFLPIKAVEDNIVRESTDINVRFSIPRKCEETNVWKVGHFDGVDGWAVKLGGVEGYHGPGTADSMFKIQKVGNLTSYIFRFCPSYPRTRLIPCGNVGIDFDTGRRLVLREHAKIFVFVKVVDKLMNIVI